ncbi:hypothetical protein Vsou_13670 [Vulcanisaeta souniana JCM 11219]|uniref:Uncharacterized protein n=1 Tax=Vulcanisaeta souniana JCM 11219 TaxID=1293586 RepID=A0ABN6SS65_9CREN|nr:hypothetical protein Vsou_13670 [Vulcanisaeta souniana JCM 11219]
MTEILILPEGDKQTVHTPPPCLVRHENLFNDLLEKFKYNKFNYQFYHIKTPQLRKWLGSIDKDCQELKLNDVTRYLTARGFLILALGGDGSNSSWIIAVDPRDVAQLQFLASWCGSLKFTRQVIEDKDYVLRSITYMQLPDSVKEDLRTAVRTILDVYSTCIGELRDREVCMNESSLTVVYREWAFLLTNSKVRLVKDPCKALRRITRGGDGAGGE